MEKRAFVFLYSNMDLGGIQRYIYNYVKVFNRNDIATYWITTRKPIIDDGFAAEFEKVHIIHNVTHKKMRKILEPYDNVVALTFSVLQFEKLKRLVRYNSKIRSLYVIPHFKNPEIYPEEYFYIEACQERVRRWLAEYYNDYIANNELFYISRMHGITLCEHYGLANDDIQSHLCKGNRQISGLDLSVIQKKIQNRDTFNLITVSRFEFPHKGYVLGLIDSFIEIRRRIRIARLYIIGYGDGEAEVKKRIAALPKDISKDIVILGRVPYGELKRYYDLAQISIAVAGSASDGASMGVPTLVARHYYEKCEVYGEYIDCADRTLSDESGEDVVPYIEDVYRMGDIKYLELCKATYKTAKDILEKDFDPFWMFKVVQKESIIHSSIQIRILNFRAWLWIWGRRCKMLLCDPKTFLEKTIRRFGA